MHPRESSSITEKMWKGAISASEEVNTSFSDCLNDKDTPLYCLMMSCVSGCTVPIGFCACWLVSCALPPVGACALTPVTGLVDCGIFACKQTAKACSPERQVMRDEDPGYYSFRQPGPTRTST